ncbi:MAG: type II toxin-antitoxin system VapC family toxin [Chlorobiales bacterium]|nr:type II toxin-antitoxin system VapC family toxin [Chlorobiales bacterium]
MSYLLDTCVISELVRKSPDKSLVQWVDNQNEFDLYLSVITLGEIQKGITKLSSSKKKELLTSWLKDELEVRFAERIVPITDEVALMWGNMLGEAEKNGRPLSVVDMLIAATAKVYDLVVVTRNVRDMKAGDVDILNPWETV